MGLFDMFSKEGRDERTRNRNIKRAINKYMQSPDRWKALEALRADGTGEAIYGMLRRFGMMYDKSIEDEQEKEWVFDALVEQGVRIVPQVERYILAADSISWPLRLLSKIADKNTELAVIQRVLERHEPGYERDPTKKIQLMGHLAAVEDARVPALCVPYLADMDEGVRYAAAEALLRRADEAAALDPLAKHFMSEGEDSLRIRLLIADGFIEHGWSVKPYRPAFDEKLPEAYGFEKDGRLKKRAPTAG